MGSDQRIEGDGRHLGLCQKLRGEVDIKGSKWTVKMQDPLCGTLIGEKKTCWYMALNGGQLKLMTLEVKPIDFL